MKFILDDDETENLNVGLILDNKIPSMRQGRKPPVQLGDIDKAIIAADRALTGRPLNEIAKENNIHRHTAASAEKRAPGEVKLEIQNKLRQRLELAIDTFDPLAVKQKDLPAAINSLSGALARIEGNHEENGKQIVFNVYAPRVQSEDEFNVIEVN